LQVLIGHLMPDGDCTKLLLSLHFFATGPKKLRIAFPAPGRLSNAFQYVFRQNLLEERLRRINSWQGKLGNLPESKFPLLAANFVPWMMESDPIPTGDCYGVLEMAVESLQPPANVAKGFVESTIPLRCAANAGKEHKAIILGNVPLERLLAQVLFSESICETGLEGFGHVAMLDILHSLLLDFCKTVDDTALQQIVTAMAGELMTCARVELNRSSAQLSDDVLAKFSDEIAAKICALGKGELHILFTGWSVGKTSHSSYVVFCGCEDDAIEIYEINGIGGAVHRHGGEDAIYGRRSLPARCYRIEKNALFPKIGPEKNVRSSTFIHGLLLAANGNSLSLQFYDALWNNWNGWQIPAPQHLVKLFIRLQRSGNCTIKSSELLLLVQLAVHLNSAPNALRIFRTLLFFLDLHLVQNYLLTIESRVPVGPQSWEILKRSKEGLAYQAIKLQNCPHEPDETLFSFLNAWSITLLERAERALAKHSPTIFTGIRWKDPSILAEQDQKTMALLLQELAPHVNSYQQPFCTYLPNNLVARPTTSSDMLNYLNALRSSCGPTQIVILVRPLPLPIERRFSALYSAIIQVNEPHAMADAISTLAKNLQGTTCARSAYIRTTFYHLKVMAVELLCVTEFWKDVLKDYYVDPWPLLGQDAADAMEVTDRASLEERDLCLQHVKTCQGAGNLPIFAKYDGVGSTGNGDPRPHELAMLVQMLQQFGRQDPNQCLLLRKILWENEKKYACPATWDMDERLAAVLFFEDDAGLQAVEEYVPNGEIFVRFLRACIAERACLSLDQTIQPFFDAKLNLICCNVSRSSTKKDKVQHHICEIAAENTALIQEWQRSLWMESESCYKSLLQTPLFEAVVEPIPTMQSFALLARLLNEWDRYFPAQENSSRPDDGAANLRQVWKMALFKTVWPSKDTCEEIRPIVHAVSTKNFLFPLLKLLQQIVLRAMNQFYFVACSKSMDLQKLFFVLECAYRIRFLAAEYNPKEFSQASGENTFPFVYRPKDNPSQLVGIESFLFSPLLFGDQVFDKQCMEQLAAIRWFHAFTAEGQKDLATLTRQCHELAELTLNKPQPQFTPIIFHMFAPQSPLVDHGLRLDPVPIPSCLADELPTRIVGNSVGLHSLHQAADGIACANPIFPNIVLVPKGRELIVRRRDADGRLWQAMPFNHPPLPVPIVILATTTQWKAVDGGDMEFCDASGRPVYRSVGTGDSMRLRKVDGIGKDLFLELEKENEGIGDYFSAFEARGEYFYLLDGDDKRSIVLFPRYRDAAGDPLHFIQKNGLWYHGSDFVVEFSPTDRNLLENFSHALVLRPIKTSQPIRYLIPDGTITRTAGFRSAMAFTWTRTRPSDEAIGGNPTATAMQVVVDNRTPGATEFRPVGTAAALGLAYIFLSQNDYDLAWHIVGKIPHHSPLDSTCHAMLTRMAQIFAHDSSPVACAVVLRTLLLQLLAENTVACAMPLLVSLCSKYVEGIAHVPLPMRLPTGEEKKLILYVFKEGIQCATPAIKVRLQHLNTLKPASQGLDWEPSQLTFDVEVRDFLPLPQPTTGNGLADVSDGELELFQKFLQICQKNLKQSAPPNPRSIFVEISRISFSQLFTIQYAQQAITLTKEEQLLASLMEADAQPQGPQWHVHTVPIPSTHSFATLYAQLKNSSDPAEKFHLLHTALTELYWLAPQKSLTIHLAAIILKVVAQSADAASLPKLPNLVLPKESALSTILDFLTAFQRAADALHRQNSTVGMIPSPAMERASIFSWDVPGEAVWNALHSEKLQKVEKPFVPKFIHWALPRPSMLHPRQQPPDSVLNSLIQSIEQYKTLLAKSPPQTAFALARQTQVEKLLDDARAGSRILGERIGWNFSLPKEQLSTLAGQVREQRERLCMERAMLEEDLLAMLNRRGSAGHVGNLLRHANLQLAVPIEDAVVACSLAFAQQSHDGQALALRHLLRHNISFSPDSLPILLANGWEYMDHCNAIARMDRVLATVADGLQNDKTLPPEAIAECNRRLAEEWDADDGAMDPHLRTLFEHLCGNIRLYPLQIKAILHAVQALQRDAADGGRAVLQLRMGLGKSVFLIPALVFYAAKILGKTPLVCIDETQMAAVLPQLRTGLGRLGLSLHPIDLTTQQCEQKQFLGPICQSLEDAAQFHDRAFLVPAITLCALRAMAYANGPTSLQAKFTNHPFALFIDEAHLACNPCQSFALEVSDTVPKCYDRDDAALIRQVVQLFGSETSLRNTLAAHSNEQAAHFDAAIYHKRLMPMLADLIYTLAWGKKPCFSKQSFLDFVTGNTHTIPMRFDHDAPAAALHKLHLFRILLVHYLPAALCRKALVDYNWDADGLRCIPCHLSIPSQANYRDPTMEIVQETMLAMQTPLTERHILGYAALMVGLAEQEMIKRVIIPFDETEPAQQFFALFSLPLSSVVQNNMVRKKIHTTEARELLKNLLLAVNGTADTFTAALLIDKRIKIIQAISNCPIAQRFIDVNKMELVNLGNGAIALSGTVENLAVLPQAMGQNTLFDPGTVGTLLLNIFSETEKGQAICSVIPSMQNLAKTMTNYLTTLAKKNLTPANVRALLDMGALLSPAMEANARAISTAFSSLENGSKIIDGILFAGNHGFAILDRRAVDEKIIPVTDLDDDALSLIEFSDRTRLFLLLDQAHCTGTNFPGLHPMARGVILVDPNSLRSSLFVQTVMRLRQFGQGQHIDLLVDQTALQTARQRLVTNDSIPSSSIGTTPPPSSVAEWIAMMADGDAKAAVQIATPGLMAHITSAFRRIVDKSSHLSEGNSFASQENFTIEALLQQASGTALEQLVAARDEYAERLEHIDDKGVEIFQYETQQIIDLGNRLMLGTAQADSGPGRTVQHQRIEVADQQQDQQRDRSSQVEREKLQLRMRELERERFSHVANDMLHEKKESLAIISQKESIISYAARLLPKKISETGLFPTDKAMHAYATLFPDNFFISSNALSPATVPITFFNPAMRRCPYFLIYYAKPAYIKCMLITQNEADSVCHALANQLLFDPCALYAADGVFPLAKTSAYSQNSVPNDLLLSVAIFNGDFRTAIALLANNELLRKSFSLQQLQAMAHLFELRSGVPLDVDLFTGNRQMGTT
jgi:hypothetical protein